jgi:hypothetical protein
MLFSPGIVVVFSGAMVAQPRYGVNRARRSMRSQASQHGIEAKFVMPGHSRPKDGVASLAYVPGIHAFFPNQGVDGRDEPGHDVERLMLDTIS